MNAKLRNEITKVCNAEITKHLWGVQISNSPNGNMPRFLITDYRALGLLTGIIRYYAHRENISEQIYYRGQSKEWPLKPSLYRYCTSTRKLQLAEIWKTRALEVISEEQFDFNGTNDEREALAQHYGLSTSFIDVVDHIQTALWFACDKLTENESVGYVYVLSIPREKAKVIDLRNKPSKWLRPHTQQAFCFKMNKITELGKISGRYHIMTFVIPKDLLRRWSNYDAILKEYMYPPLSDDNGAQFWDKAEQRLRNAGLETNPEKWIGQQLALEVSNGY